MEVLLREPGVGRLVKDLSPASLAEAMEGLLRDRVSSPRAAETIRGSVLRYSWPRVALDVLAVYHDDLAAAAGLIRGSVPGIPAGSGPPAACGTLMPAWAGDTR
jgi:hypothetical protein